MAVTARSFEEFTTIGRNADVSINEMDPFLVHILSRNREMLQTTAIPAEDITDISTSDQNTRLVATRHWLEQSYKWTTVINNCGETRYIGSLRQDRYNHTR
jgi:hypothetical protein